ncbi:MULTISPECIES: Lar family restriction alleviation protein [Burkholderia]|uniref:Lar family restriction alleviation protein n=1 Tax=Burkholderia TaxID=32008 RepID=UPI000DAC319F
MVRYVECGSRRPRATTGGIVSELKPCPFCGATAAVEKIGRDWWRLKALHDDECALDSDHMLQAPHTPEGRAWVIAAWNRRAPASEGEQK